MGWRAVAARRCPAGPVARSPCDPTQHHPACCGLVDRGCPRTRRQGSGRGPPHPALGVPTAPFAALIAPSLRNQPFHPAPPNPPGPGTAFVQSWTGDRAGWPHCHRTGIPVHAHDTTSPPGSYRARTPCHACHGARALLPPCPGPAQSQSHEQACGEESSMRQRIRKMRQRGKRLAAAVLALAAVLFALAAWQIADAQQPPVGRRAGVGQRGRGLDRAQEARRVPRPADLQPAA